MDGETEVQRTASMSQITSRLGAESRAGTRAGVLHTPGQCCSPYPCGPVSVQKGLSITVGSLKDFIPNIEKNKKRRNEVTV